MPKTKYTDIYKSLKTKIETGEYEFQELLPSENSLILTYNCSRNTIRRAISALVTDGYVQTMQEKVSVIFSNLPYKLPLLSAELNHLKNLLSEIIKFQKQKFYTLQRLLRTKKYVTKQDFLLVQNCIICYVSTI